MNEVHEFDLQNAITELKRLKEEITSLSKPGTYIELLSITNTQAWRGSTVVKNTRCFPRAPVVMSQHPHHDS